jgi:transcription initiation factor TFIIB
MDDHFKLLDEFNQDKEIKNTSCCSLKENYQNDNGTIICKKCQNTIYNISTEAEWRCYGTNEVKNQDPTRCGMPVNILLPESSVGSTVAFNYNNKTMGKIRQYQQWQGMPYKERSKYKVFNEITEICKQNNIPTKIINEAKSLYNIVTQTKISRGANRKGIIGACLYFACKECNVPRGSKEIAIMFNIDSKVMTKGCKKCQEIIQMNKSNKNRLSTNTSIKPCDFIERFCNKLNIDDMNIQAIFELCNRITNQNIICENTPQSVAAGCILYYCKHNNIEFNKKEISSICKISEVTINKCNKKIYDYFKNM